MKLFIIRLMYLLKRLSENPADLFRTLGVEDDDKILEIGCAVGYHTFPLSEITSKGMVYAVDVWEDGLAYLEHKAIGDRHIKVIHVSAELIELPVSSVDKIVCFDTLHDLPDWKNAINRWTGFLVEGGTLLYRDPIISAEKIETASKGKLQRAKTLNGIQIFIHHTAAGN